MGRRQRWAGIMSVRPLAARELQAHAASPLRSGPRLCTGGPQARPWRHAFFPPAHQEENSLSFKTREAAVKTGLLAGAGARAPATPSPAPSAAQPGLLSDQRSGLGGRAAQRRGPTPSSRSRTTRVPRGRRPGPTHSPLRSLPGKGSPHPPQSRRPGGSSETCPRRPQLTWPGAPEAEHREPGSCAHRGLFNLRGSLRSRPSGSDARALLGDAGSAARGLRFRTWAPLLAGPPAAAACDPFWRAGRGVGGPGLPDLPAYCAAFRRRGRTWSSWPTGNGSQKSVVSLPRGLLGVVVPRRSRPQVRAAAALGAPSRVCVGFFNT